MCQCLAVGVEWGSGGSITTGRGPGLITSPEPYELLCLIPKEDLR